MTLRAAEPTQRSLDAVSAALSELAGRSEFRRRALARVNPLDVALAVPHDVYTLGLDEVADRAGIEQARHIGRRFLVMAGNRAVSSAEIADEDGTGFQANEGPYVVATAEAIARAEDDPDLAKGDYEIRLLRIPALYFVALWLRDERGHDDVLVPLDPAPEPFEPGRNYGPDEVLTELAASARTRLEFDDVEGSSSHSAD
ncbi:MAG TPA: hypothetical protein VFH02_03975 [Jiangellaceae bacterium]|jgi:hypothetical protein|nr:hypothetical protein [Jiangellaceae bacterium]